MNAPRLKGELRYVLKPWAVRRRWALFYVFACIVLLLGANFAAEKYRTYSIPTGSVELKVPYVTYLVGEPITFTVVNNFGSAIYIPNECPGEPLRVYKFTDGAWKNISATTAAENCTIKDRQIKVAAHGSQSGNFNAWPDLFKEPGKYRLVAYVDYYNSAPYQDFEIIAKPQKQKVYVKAPAPQQVSTTSNTSTSTKRSTSSQSSTTTSPAPATPALRPYSVTLSSGTVQVEYSTSRIYIRSVQPAAGCTYESDGSGASVEIQFKCSGDETTLQLWLSGGTIQQKVES